jgi:hypothetical protein
MLNAVYAKEKEREKKKKEKKVHESKGKHTISCMQLG